MNVAPTYALPATVTLTVSHDEAVLLDLADESMYALNGSAARIVELLTSGHDVLAAIEMLNLEYGADRDQLESDVLTLIEVLVGKRLLQPVESFALDE